MFFLVDYRQQRRRGKNRRARKGLRRKYSKSIASSMLKSLETRRNTDHHIGKDKLSIAPIARSRRSRNRHKIKDRTESRRSHTQDKEGKHIQQYS